MSDSCRNCGEPLHGGDAFSLPVSGVTGDYIGQHYDGTWGGVPCCRDCNALYTTISVPGDPALEGVLVNAVLDAYAKVVERRTQALDAARTALLSIRQHVDTAEREIGLYE